MSFIHATDGTWVIVTDDISKQPTIPPYHALLDGPDPNAPRHLVLGKNFRVLRDDGELMELPGGDIRSKKRCSR